MTTNQEKNNLVERCNETAVCTRLQVRLESRALKGFFAVHSFDKDGKPVLHGVLYKQAAADEGEFIKVCPFCCHRPGRIEPGKKTESGNEFLEKCPECESDLKIYHNGCSGEVGETCIKCGYSRKLL